MVAGPDTSATVQRIHAMLHPRNIGAGRLRTDKPGNYAERIWNNLIKYKFGVACLYPVNAKRETIWGVPCYKDFTNLPDKPDHVLVLVPAALRRPGHSRCSRGRRALGDQSSLGLQRIAGRGSAQRLAVELQQAIRETGLAVTGPNCHRQSEPRAKISSPISTTASSPWKRARSRSPANPARS